MSHTHTSISFGPHLLQQQLAEKKKAKVDRELINEHNVFLQVCIFYLPLPSLHHLFLFVPPPCISQKYPVDDVLCR
jgi:hypothetical protein